VDNKAGAGGLIAGEAFAKSAPRGFLAPILIAVARAVFQGAAFFLLSMLHHGCYRSGAEGVGNKEQLNSIR